MAAVTDTRGLAARLAERDEAALETLFTAYAVSADPGWRDMYDVALALREPGPLERGLGAVARPAAAALLAASTRDAAVPPGAEREALAALELVGPDGRVDAVVRTMVGRRTVPPAADARRPASADENRAAADRAFTSVGALADVLLGAATAPLGLTAAGALSATDRRRLVDAGVADSPATADGLVEIAVRAGLLVAHGRALVVTADGWRWLGQRTADRWQEVARRLLAALPAGLHTPEGRALPVDAWTDAYPFDPGWPDRAGALRAAVVLWGLVAPSGAEPGWADGDAATLETVLPAEVDRLYLQNDLSAIAPGPLAAAADLRLRTMAERESRAQASSYRFTADSIARAVTAGETAASLLAFLGEVSLTGVPQPLVYLVERTAFQHGLVQVRTDDTRSVVTSDDAVVLESIAVDQALRPLGLVRDGERLISRAGADTVFWMLADARYPVVATDADGAPRRLDRRVIADPAASVSAPSRHATLIARLRAAHDDDAAGGWLARELDQAVRARAVVVVTVRLPDGSEREFTLEASGLGGGRLRGRDRSSDVERTLPVSSIVGLRAPD